MIFVFAANKTCLGLDRSITTLRPMSVSRVLIASTKGGYRGARSLYSGERLNGIQEVRGSIPLISTKLLGRNDF